MISQEMNIGKTVYLTSNLESIPDTTLNLLLLENDIESGKAMKLMLERRGANVTHVTSVADALADMQDTPYDIAVADIRLEGRSGVEYLREVRQHDSDFPVILLTGYDSLDSAIQAIRLGAQDYILKPLDSIEDLLIPVQKAVRNYHLILRNSALEKELTEREKRLAAIFDNAAVGIVLIDQNGHLIQANDRALTMLRYEQQDIATVNMHDIFKPADMHDIESGFHDLRRNRMTYFQMEKQLLRKDKSEIWVAISVSTIRDENDDIVAQLGVLTDIDKQKRMAKELRDSQDQLVQSEKLAAIGQLAAGVAHELNQPLTHINITAQLLERMMHADTKQTKPLLDELQVIRENVTRATSVICSLRDFSRRENTPPEPVDIREVIHTATSMFSGQLAKEHIALNSSISNDPLIATAAMNRLTQVVVNLIGNARDALIASNTNSPKIISVSAYEENNQIIIHVEDNGIGIPDDVMPHIFTPFYTTKEVGKGTGLGLSVSLQIVKNFNGTLKATSVPDQGSIMSILLEKATLANECVTTR